MSSSAAVVKMLDPARALVALTLAISRASSWLPLMAVSFEMWNSVATIVFKAERYMDPTLEDTPA